MLEVIHLMHTNKPILEILQLMYEKSMLEVLHLMYVNKSML